ncbi:uncharacterized protein FYW47_014028 [Aplochiton taeniatus]
MLNDAEEFAQALEQDIDDLRRGEQEGKPHLHIEERIHFLMKFPSFTQAFTKMQMHVSSLEKDWDDYFAHAFKSCSNSVEEDLGPYTLLSLCSKTVEEEDLEDFVDLETVRTQELNAFMEDILDRLERDNFDTSMKLVDTLPINTEERVEGVIKLIYDEAISDREDPKVCMNMCYRMRDLKVPSSGNPGLTVDFHQLLLKHCQTEFNRERLIGIHEKRKELPTKKGEERRWLKLELDQARTGVRDEAVNNIKFICQLFRKKMLREDVMHSYIAELLRRGDTISLECVCAVMTTIGKDLDVERAKAKMDNYYLHFKSIIKKRKSTPEVCNMLEELLELRRFVIVLFCPDVFSAQMGTTPNLKDIVIGRCFDYVTLVHPSFRYDCEEIWSAFEEAVVRRSPCDVKVRDYRRMFGATPQALPCDRLLFWSKTRSLMHIYAAVNPNLWTLENTLVGYVFNDLVWCGQQQTGRGFDFDTCPEWSTCVNHPVYSLWRQASQNFAAGACGNITVLLNGSIHNAFNKKSMFGSVELDSLNPRMVDHVNINVVTNMEGPFIESCTEGSILDLIKVLKGRGFQWTCTDNDLNDCLKIWSVFEKAYVGQNPCNVTTEAYDSLILTVTSESSCNRKLFWSKTKDMAHEFTERMNCFLTLEDTLLGFILDGLTWCGKEGSDETFTEGCPSWKQCLNNTVSSFWKRASASFAEEACGEATAMLNGSITQPFNPTSIFATVEVKSFNFTRMSGLSVVLVTNRNNMTNCENPSLKDLQKELNPKLKYSCMEVPESKIQDCISHSEIVCGPCW